MNGRRSHKNRVTYEWIRIDPEMDWLCELTFDQPDYMAVAQLRKDKDVVSQMDSLKSLAKLQTPLTTSSITAFLKDPNYFYRVRGDAAFALARVRLCFIYIY